MQRRAVLRKRAPWRAPALGAGVVALVVALAVWFVREPSARVDAAPLTVPKLRRPSKPVAAGESIDSDAPESEAPTMPVGTSELPEQLDRHQLENGMAKAFHAVERCWELERFVGRMRVHLVIAKTGNPQSVQVTEPEARTPTTDCVAKAVHNNASFPRFRGTLLPTVELIYPFLFKDDGHLGP